MVRGIQSYHMDANGYCDIAYNFLIDKYGQIFEGRDGGIDKPVIGGHAGGFNTGSVGVALIGDYSTVKPTDAQWQALVHLLRWRLSVGGVDPADGHRGGAGRCGAAAGDRPDAVARTPGSPGSSGQPGNAHLLDRAPGLALPAPPAPLGPLPAALGAAEAGRPRR